MSRVHILPPELVSKIAAGEVVERPAAVVKELVENAIDAGARILEVRLSGAGKTLISVKDDGSGITADDMERIFSRHATSKIETLDDLYEIRSLGFRGEALYSIAAVSDIILRSRARNSNEGWEIHLRGGKRLDLRPAALNTGCEIEVKELFFNTPARRKFLRAPATELNQILGILIPYALINPAVRFLAAHEGKTLLVLAPTESLIDRAAAALNLDAANLLNVEEDIPQLNTRLRLVLGDMNIHRARRDLQFIYVNGRPVQSKAIAFHLNNVYRLVMPEGSFPFFLVDIHLPPQDVDANIHPTKREVKLRDEQGLCAVLRRIVEETLMTGGRAKQVSSEAPPTPAFLSGRPGEEKDDEPREHMMDFSRPFPSPAQTAPEALTSVGTAAAKSLPLSGVLIPEGQRSAPLKERLAHARFVGQFADKFLLFESQKVLLIIDQHAAQERIVFEKLLSQMEKGQVEVQRLLSPTLLKLTPQDLLAFENAENLLERIGFACTKFDEETLAVHSYPVLIKNVERGVREVLAELISPSSTSQSPAPSRDVESIARRACRASVMAGEGLKPAQAEYQRQQLLKCRDPFTCPHGRPTVVEISAGYLDKQFLRT